MRPEFSVLSWINMCNIAHKGLTICRLGKEEQRNISEKSAPFDSKKDGCILDGGL